MDEIFLASFYISKIRRSPIWLEGIAVIKFFSIICSKSRSRFLIYEFFCCLIYLRFLSNSILIQYSSKYWYHDVQIVSDYILRNCGTMFGIRWVEKGSVKICLVKIPNDIGGNFAFWPTPFRWKYLLFLQTEESYTRNLQQTQPKRKRLECQVDCKRDSECKTGLVCAKEHKVELEAVGLNLRKAYCGSVGSFNQFVCYDPRELTVSRCKAGIASGDKCIASEPKTCYSGTPTCCRTLKRTTSDGKKVCNPRDCFYTKQCDCATTAEGSKWNCKSQRSGCVTDCSN
jgi:hypothetical protein